jgi:hypothetical protein
MLHARPSIYCILLSNLADQNCTIKPRVAVLKHGFLCTNHVCIVIWITKTVPYNLYHNLIQNLVIHMKMKHRIEKNQLQKWLAFE